ncbi:MAG: alpha/beta hydrolase [Gammaproteobacteria bacterium]|nr:alpha/beta hydrolase [Gammaproteobacteria bacterium]NNF61344.1 alpha/beta hydrolase [Gammaproteobacteria bacterium]
MRTLFLLLGLAALLYAGIAAYVWRFQGRFLYFPDIPTRQLQATPLDAGMPYEDVALTTSDGVALHGWYVPGRDTRTILFFHGNAGNISHRLESIAIFNRLGANVFIIDYRGYGRSGGKPDETGTYRDAQAAWDHLTVKRRIAPGDIVIFGRSLGGAVAAWLAAQVTPAGVILESTFTSVPAMAREVYPFLPSSLARIRYDTRSRIAAITSPLLLLHSDADETIPYHMSEQLLSAASRNARLVTLKGGHSDAHLVSGMHYFEALREFLAR